MDRLFANGTVNAALSGEGPPLFLLHSLLSDRASFDAIVPDLSKSFTVIVPELPGFGGSQAVKGGLAAVADRMAEAVKDAAGGKDAIVLGNGYGGCRWPFAIPPLRPGSCSRIAARRSRNRDARRFATWRRPQRPGDCPRLRMWRCGVCSRRNFRPRIPT